MRAMRNRAKSKMWSAFIARSVNFCGMRPKAPLKNRLKLGPDASAPALLTFAVGLVGGACCAIRKADEDLKILLRLGARLREDGIGQ